MFDNVSQDSTFIKHTLTGGEMWIYELKKPRPNQSKVMLIIFLNYRDAVHHEFLTQGQTVNKEYYLAADHRKQPDSWAENSSIIHLDKASSYSSMIVTKFLAQTRNESQRLATIFARFSYL